MNTIDCDEAKVRWSELIKLVETGEEVVITRNGRAVARLVPADRHDPDRVRRAIAAIKALRARAPGGPIDILELVRDGRRH